jgi:hypothetical protein
MNLEEVLWETKGFLVLSDPSFLLLNQFDLEHRYSPGTRRIFENSRNEYQSPEVGYVQKKISGQ